MDDEQEEEEEAEVSSQEEEISPVLARPAGKRGRPKSQPANPQHPTPTVVSTPDVFQDQSDSDVSDDASTTAQGNLTRRQRSKLTRAYDSELLELPVEAKRSKFSAEEAALRKSEHARRRKFQSMQRAEQLKNDTINRLLNKQTSKGRNKVTEDSETRSVSDEPMDAPLGIIRYVQRVVEVQDKKEARVDRLLALPRDVEISRVLPGAGCSLEYPQPSKMCSVSGCEEKKKYSVDAMAACSLKHWRMLKSEQTGMVKQK
ncbi:INO80 complex subunit B [Coemansia sp. Benny D115]|nr:INO80 complex subunit B [Coemansia sp. Benny D115]